MHNPSRLGCAIGINAKWPPGLKTARKVSKACADGWVAERFKAPVLKTGDVKASVGSNPTPSATRRQKLGAAPSKVAAPFLSFLIDIQLAFTLQM